MVDYYAASMLSTGVCAALFHRERTGEGQYLGVSLLRSALAMQSGRFIWAEGERRDLKRDMRSGGITGIDPTASGNLYISANTPHFWQAFCELTGLLQLATNPDYDTVKKRAARARELIPQVRAALQKNSALEWEEIFGERVPCCAVRTIEDMFDHPQAIAEDVVAQFEHSAVGRYRGLSRALKFTATPGPQPFCAPALGEHTVAVLHRHGYTTEEIQRLRDSHVIPAEEGIRK